MPLQITLKLDAAMRFDDSAGVFVSWCPALDVYSQGETADESAQALESALVLWIKQAYQRSVLDDLLLTRGFDRIGLGRGPGGSSRQFIGVEEIPEMYRRQTFQVDLPLTLSQSSVNALGGNSARTA